MYLFLAIVLLGVIIVGSIAIAVAVPFFFGLLAYDVNESRKREPLEEREAKRRVTVERGWARAFVIGGGAFWSVASLVGLYSFQRTGVNSVLLGAFFPLVACVATLVVGWYYERPTAALLALASVGVVAWGVIYQLEAGAWLLVTLALIGPMMTASVLFWLARADQELYERTAEIRLVLSPLFDARSSLAVDRAAA